MASYQFMYDEAFDFKNEQDIHKFQQQANRHDIYDEPCQVMSDGEQRLPPLGACSNEPTTESSNFPVSTVYVYYCGFWDNNILQELKEKQSFPKIH